jgi:hypothetical protein
VREHLKDGRLTIYLSPIEGKLKVGDTIKLKIGLQDDAMAQAVYSEELTLNIVDAESDQKDKKRSKEKNKKSGDAKNQQGNGEDAPTHGLPRCVLLTRDGREIPGYAAEKWPDDFSDSDGGAIADLGEEVVYKINYDNAYHIKYRLSQRGDVSRDVVTEKYILGMRILLLGYQHAFKSIQKSNGSEGNGISEYADEFRRTAARAAASTVLALAENLPKIVDASSIQNQEVE